MPDSPGKRSIDQGGQAPATQGETAQSRGEKPEPKEPYERDESAASQDSEAPTQAEVGEQAHDDIERGLVDTGRSPVTNRVYKERLKGNEPPPSGKP